VDADIRVAPDWLLRGVKAVEANPLHPYGGDVRIDFADPRNATGIEAFEAFEAVFSFRQKMYIKRKGFSGTGNLMVDRELWEKVGPFGPIGTAEDTAWGLKAKSLGHPTKYLRRMIVFHPARLSMADVESRWGRIIAHRFGEHVESGRPMIVWHARAYAVMLSALAHAPQLLLSARVPTLGARLRGLGVLFETRWYRFMKMRRIARGGHLETAMQWNRTS
jgi:GT2 family glycosyltransferase